MSPALMLSPAPFAPSLTLLSFAMGAEMGQEGDLQDWCVERARTHQLAAAIDWGSGSGDCAWAPPPDAVLDPSDAVTARVLTNFEKIHAALLDAVLVTADQNLRLTYDETYKPDLLLHNAEDDIYILVELKVGRNAGREALTELLGYAELIRETFHDPEIHLVVASEQWKPLLSSAARGQLRSKGYPLLSLVVGQSDANREEGAPRGYTLTVHWDLLRRRGEAALLTPDVFVCDTAAFTFEQGDRDFYTFTGTQERMLVEQALVLAAQAERMEPVPIGFVLIWQTDYRTWNVTTCNLNRSRLAVSLPKESPLFHYRYPDTDGIPYGAQHPADIKTGNLLLHTLNLDAAGAEVERTGFEDWPQAQLLLRHWNARLVFAVGYGVTKPMFGGALPVRAGHGTNLELRGFPPHHPFRWLPQLDRMTNIGFDAGDLALPSTLHALGSILGAATDYYAYDADALVDSENFGYLAATARLIAAWDEVCHAWQEAGRTGPPPQLHFEDHAGTRLMALEVDVWRTWCITNLCQPGSWQLFAFRIGFAQAFAERRALEPWIDGATSDSIVVAANRLLAWAGTASAVARSEEAHLALERFRRLQQSERFEIGSLAWRDTCLSLAVLADVAMAAGYLVEDLP